MNFLYLEKRKENCIRNSYSWLADPLWFGCVSVFLMSQTKYIIHIYTIVLRANKWGVAAKDSNTNKKCTSKNYSWCVCLCVSIVCFRFSPISQQFVNMVRMSLAFFCLYSGQSFRVWIGFNCVCWIYSVSVQMCVCVFHLFCPVRVCVCYLGLYIKFWIEL